MVSVTADQIRKRLSLTVADITDDDVLVFRGEAAAFLSEEIGKTLDAENCTEAEANAIRNLAAIYCYCKVSGGSAVGLDFSVGDLRVSPNAGKQLEFLKEQVERFIARQKRLGISLLEGP
ncbi:hypothetical protein G4O51_13090 [Candidatus Bathyarchaeota archaeon A05DMB-2]|jgi:hypothetical protein|nr:hypothetical protein [Candidatus Bathyarchaeota archaeon A05DMB-2]